jgi:hypothetical protein
VRRWAIMGDIAHLGSGGEFLLYQTADGQTRIQCRLQGETIWLTQQQMADLFQVDKSGISRHLKNIYESGELSQESVVAKFATTASDGKTYHVEHYNLDAIISVGYRVNSIRGTQFRIWATGRLREYLVKGFAMDDERLKDAAGGNYFDELPKVRRRGRVVANCQLPVANCHAVWKKPVKNMKNTTSKA